MLNSKFGWVAELVVEIKENSSELARICAALGDRPDTVVLTVAPTTTATKITCGLIEPVPFLRSLSDVPEVASWCLTPN